MFSFLSRGQPKFKWLFSCLTLHPGLVFRCLFNSFYHLVVAGCKKLVAGICNAFGQASRKKKSLNSVAITKGIIGSVFIFDPVSSDLAVP